MTKISNQYSLTNILTADLANSRLGINNVSPTVALDVTGAGKFSSSVTSDDLILTAGTLFSAGNTGFSNRLSDTTLYLQMPATGFNITDNALNTRFILSSAGAATFQSVNAKTNTGNWHQTIADLTSMASGVGGGISFTGYKTGTTAQGLYAAIDGFKENATAGNELGGFRIWTSNGTNLVERMRITSGGNLLVGTTTDGGYKFEVNGGSSAVATRVISSGSTTAGTLWDGGGAPSFHAWSRPQDCGIGSNNFTGASILIKTGMSYGSFSTGTTRIEIQSGGAVIIPGSLSKGSGSFRIDHPLKPDTHQLVHSFIEGPQADLIYRGKLTLVNGKAQANIDEVSTMTEGTFEALCREVQCFTTNENGWDLVKGKVIGNIIYIESQNPNSTDEISWMVIGERKDKHMMDTEWTDEQGKVIVEPLKA